MKNQDCNTDTCEKPWKSADWAFCLRPGRSPTVDVWSPSLRGLSGRLVSYTQPPRSTESCLSFFYKLYGPDAGKDRGGVKGEGRRRARRFKVPHLVQVLWMWSWQTKWILRSSCGPAVEHTATFGMKRTAQCRPRLQNFRFANAPWNH